MKSTLVIIVCVLFLLSFNSCRQCTNCVKYPAPDEKLCKKDFASAESYDDAYKHLVAQGYDCD